MQQAVDALPFRGIEDGLDCPGNAGLLSEACEPTPREGVQRIADSLDTTADLRGNLRWGLLPGAGQDNLATAQSKRILGAQTAFEVTAFIIGQRANKHRWFHGRKHDTGMSFCTRPLLRLH
jgi:hypothetical protein